MPTPARPKNPKGYPRGGRKKGSYNKDWISVPEILSSMKFEPVQELVRLLRKPCTASMVGGKMVIEGLSDESKADKLIQMMRFIYPQLAAVQMTVDKPDDELQNKKLDQMHEELKAMLFDQRPDIECNGQTLSSPLSSPSSELASFTESSKPRSSNLNGTSKE